MITLELAKKLKAAGLDWEPKGHDCCALNDMEWLFGSLPEDFRRFSNWDKLIWLPSLSQLLAEIEARGYSWDCKCLPLRPECDPEYRCEIGGFGTFRTPIWGDTPEEAAGLALLWILEQGGKA